MFQNKVFSQQGYPSTKYAARKDIPAQSIQPVGISQYNICSQEGYLASRDISVQNM
jgi:hypothetical protein